MEMEYFNKRMAINVIEDALTDMSTPYGRGMVAGLCGGFYMCGLLSKDEWEAFLKRIPSEYCQSSGGKICRVENLETRANGRFLN